MSTERAQWASRLGFVMAAAGSAVGLGNIWKFPYITGHNGGGLFVLIYLVCIALVGVPIMMAEIMIGRSAQKQPVAAFETITGRKTAWTAVGWLGVAAGFIILSYYVVVAGWAMDYTLKSVVNFTRPIHQAAATAATEYRATAPLQEMRSALVQRKADHDSAEALAAIRARVRPSLWAAHERLEAAAAKPGADRKVLLEKADLAAAETAVAPLRAEIAGLKARAQVAAEAHFGGLSDRQVRDEAETLKRRDLILEKVKGTFIGLFQDGWTSVFWAGLFMLGTILVVAAGVSSGIERTCSVLMPLLLALILGMVLYGAFLPGFGRALKFTFSPDASQLRPSGVLEALGHAFFTLSLGMGAMITYGSYQRTKERLASTSLIIAGLDTLIALLACLMIFPITFSYGQEPSAGPGLVFMSMPLAFAEIGRGGMLLAIAFFSLLVIAALTSAISLLEVAASYAIDVKGWSRPRAAWTIGGFIMLLAVPNAFAGDPDFKMASWEAAFGMNFFDSLDYLASNWLLPLGGLMIALYAGWAMPRRMRDAELAGMGAGLVATWLLVIRVVAPALVIVVLLQKVGILDADELFFWGP